MSKRFTKIKELSQIRRLPRLGKIRLGVKAKSQQTGKEYPKETSYFVVPEEIAKIYGEQPIELDVMIPVEDENISFPQNYAYYGSSRGLKCSGDGERAMRTVAFQKESEGKKADKTDMSELMEVPCTCILAETGKCKQTGYLQVILPKISVGGVYQINTSSFNSIIDLNSGIDYVRAMVGRVAMVPLKLKRVPTETHHDGMKQIHYTLRLEFEGDIQTLNFLRENTHKVLEGPRLSLPVPEMENPALDETDAIPVDDAEESAQPPATKPAETASADPAPVSDQQSAPAVGAVADQVGPGEAEIIQQLDAATNFDHINLALDAARALTDTAAKTRVQRAAQKASNRIKGAK